MNIFDEFWAKDVDKDVDYVTSGMYNCLAKNIECLMFTNKIDKVELAQRLGCGVNRITKLLRGDISVDIKMLVKLSLALNCNLTITLVPERKDIGE